MALMPFKRKKDDTEDRAALDREVDVVLRVLARYPPEARLSFGAPVRCPVCSNFGLVEQVDRAAGRSQNRCVSCGYEWVMTARAMRAARESVASSFGPMTATVPLLGNDSTAPSGGVLFSRDSEGEVNRQVLTGAGTGRSNDRPAGLSLPDDQLALPRSPLRVLLVEDNPMDIEVVKAILGPAGPDAVDLRCAKTRAEGEAAARSEEPDLVLLDLGLPDSHGFQTVTQWHFNSIEAPVMVVSGEYGVDMLDRGRALGVTAFMNKAELADFLAAGDEGTTEFMDRLETAVTA